jgi:hypothetical protein
VYLSRDDVGTVTGVIKYEICTRLSSFPVYTIILLHDDSKLLSRFLCIGHGNPDNNLESPCLTKLCRQQTEVIQNHEYEHVRGIGQGEAKQRKYKRLKLGDGQAYDRLSD